MIQRLPRSTFFPYSTLFRSAKEVKGPLMSLTIAKQIFMKTPAFLGFQPLNLLRSETADESTLVGRQLNRSEEHTSELQSQSNLVCRLLLEKKKKNKKQTSTK